MRNVPSMDESSGKGSKMQAHRSSGVVMDIAAFKASHCVGCDTDTTALRAARANVKHQRGNGTLRMGSIRGKAHRLPDNAQGNGQHFSGAMDELSGKVQSASTHIL